RRYYRSGESEYYINRHAVRLRDISELFMDTGLGKEGYALIGQGKIDEILSVKSGQRREVFEEAAGIAKFRHRKEESERKLARTEDNLLRLQDIISELELQVDPLREQSETAKKFLHLRDQLRELEISLWLEQIAVIATSQNKLDSDLALAVQDRDRISTEVDALYAKAEEFAAQMREKDEQSDQIRLDLRAQEGVSAKLDEEIAVLRNNISNNHTNAQRLRESLEQQQSREDSLKEQSAQQKGRLSEIAAEYTALQAEQAQEQARADALYSQAGALSRELEELQQRESLEGVSASEAKALLSALSSSAQEIFDQDQMLRADLSSLKQKTEEATQALQATQEEQKIALDGKNSAHNMVEGYSLRVDTRKKKLDQSLAALQTLEVEHRTATGRLNMLADMEKMYEGFSHAVKLVMKESAEGRMQNIHGPVASLLTLPKEYTIAIETALGGAMQNIVVSTPQDGKHVIETLKRRNAGRATILPLSTIRAGSLSQKGQLEQTDGFVGIANELISFDPTYAPVFANLLGRVAVVEDLDRAIAIAAQFNHQFRIVTLDGQVLNQGGSMTGGSANKSAGILSRKDELETLKTTTERQAGILATVQKDVEEQKRVVSEDQYQLEVAQGELRVFEDDILRHEGEYNRHQGLLADLVAQEAKHLLSLTQLKERADKTEADTASAREKIATLDSALAEIQEQSKQSQKSRESLAETSAKMAATISEFAVKLAGLDAEKRAVTDSLASLTTLLGDLSGDRQDNHSLLETYQVENAEFDQEIAKKQSQIVAQTKVCDDLRRDLADKAQEKLNLEGAR
ncbi:MAG: chromosome segregation protein SMC, partial [Eubacteriales bacterium]